MTADPFPSLEPTVAALLGRWPGSPSLAVVDPFGVLGGQDTGLIYPLASVTKILTALAIVSAASDGVLSLDDPAGPSNSTVRHLLSHASGLSFDENKVLSAPGVRRRYSNLGIELAANQLEMRTGKTMTEEIALRVTGPLGMTQTLLQGPASKGATGTVSDLSLLARELLAPRHFSAEIVALLSTNNMPGLPGFLPGFGNHPDNSWGLGAEIRGLKAPHWTSPNNSPGTFGHFGKSGSFLWVDQKAGIACVALSSIPFDTWAVDAWPSMSTAVLSSYA